jgi:hypothetical protein
MNKYNDRKLDALMEVSARCEEQGYSDEASRWRDCAAKYAAGESMESADTVDVIVEMTIAVVLAVVVIWSLLGVL